MKDTEKTTKSATAKKRREGFTGEEKAAMKERVNEPSQLVSAVEAVVAGGSVVDPKVVEVLVKAREIGARSRLSDLTARELEVLAELAQGKSNGAIAERLVLSKHAVEKHINSIFVKLQLPSPHDISRRVTAALMFLASGEHAGGVADPHEPRP